MEDKASDPVAWPPPFRREPGSAPRLIEVEPGHFVDATVAPEAAAECTRSSPPHPDEADGLAPPDPRTLADRGAARRGTGGAAGDAVFRRRRVGRHAAAGRQAHSRRTRPGRARTLGKPGGDLHMLMASPKDTR